MDQGLLARTGVQGSIMEYLEAPNYWSSENLGYDTRFYDSIFLAGSITGTEDNNWQKHCAGRLLPHFHVINPRRDSFDITDKSAEVIQIEWEWIHLEMCNRVLFWFSHETLAPITLFEYGTLIGQRHKKIYIGIHPEYKRKNDLIIQTHLRAPDLNKKMYFDLDEMLDNIIKDK